MARNIMYRIETPYGCFRVDAVETEAVRAYHLDHGRHLAPDLAAIRARLIPQHRAAFDRGAWWYPLTLGSVLSGIPARGNAAYLDLTSTRGRHLGRIYATPFLESR